MYKYIIILVLLLALGGSIYFGTTIITKLREENEQLRSNIEFINQNLERQQNELERVNRETQRAFEQSRRSMQVFENRDLRETSTAKPDLVEKLINRGTAEMFKELEQETRSD